MKCVVSFALLLLILVATGVASGQSPAPDLTQQFLDQYLPHVPRLTERYVQNRSLRATMKWYHLGPEYKGRPPVPYFETEITAVSDGRNFRVHSTDTGPSAPQPKAPGIYYVSRPDMCFRLTQNADRSGLVIKKHFSPEDKQDDANSDKCISCLLIPMNYGVSATIPHYLGRRGSLPYPNITVLSITPGEWQGAKAKVVRVRMQQLTEERRKQVPDWISTFYFDPDNHWMLLGSTQVTERSSDAKDYVSQQHIYYTPSEFGYPMPKRYELSRRYGDGSTVLDKSIDIHEYKAANPKPEDFTLAQYGLSEPQQPAAVSRTRRYASLFLLAAVLCAAVAAFLIWRARRRRRANQVPTLTNASPLSDSGVAS